MLAQQIAEQRAVLVQPERQLLEPGAAVAKGGDVGDHADVAWTVTHRLGHPCEILRRFDAGRAEFFGDHDDPD